MTSAPDRSTNPRRDIAKDFVAAFLQEARTSAAIPVFEETRVEAVAAVLARKPVTKKVNLAVAQGLATARHVREAINEATASALELLTDPNHVDESRLYDADIPGRRKPRVTLNAFIEDGMLLVDWQPTRDAGAPPAEAFEDLCTDSDFLACGDDGLGYAGMTLLELCPQEYEGSPVPQGAGQEAVEWANMEIINATLDGLRGMVRSLSAVCEITLEDWPAWDPQEGLVLRDALARARDMGRHGCVLSSRNMVASEAAVDTYAQSLGIEGGLALYASLREQARSVDQLRWNLGLATGRVLHNDEFEKLAHLAHQAMARATLHDEMVRAAQTLNALDFDPAA